MDGSLFFGIVTSDLNYDGMTFRTLIGHRFFLPDFADTPDDWSSERNTSEAGFYARSNRYVESQPSLFSWLSSSPASRERTH